MKHMKIFSIFILALFLATVAHAQYCKFFAMTQGMVLGYQNIDSEGKVTSKSRTTCLNVSTDTSGVIIYNVHTVVTDVKDNILASRYYEIKCSNGRFLLDLGSLPIQLQ